MCLGSGEIEGEQVQRHGGQGDQRKDFGGGRGPCVIRKWRSLALLKLEEGIERKTGG